MPPLVTVSAALLSTNTRSKRGRNFINACPARTPAAAGRTLPTREGEKKPPTAQARSLPPAPPRERGLAAPVRAPIRLLGSAQATLGSGFCNNSGSILPQEVTLSQRSAGKHCGIHFLGEFPVLRMSPYVDSPSAFVSLLRMALSQGLNLTTFVDQLIYTKNCPRNEIIPSPSDQSDLYVGSQVIILWLLSKHGIRTGEIKLTREPAPSQ